MNEGDTPMNEGDTPTPASAPCFAAQADDAYMGYADRDELAAALNELLEAERAGARVTLHSRADASDAAMAALVMAIHGDEARWCAMLSEQVKRLDAMPSDVCGAFYGKAMAIADPIERLVFLNRGQAWVVRKLAALMPRVRDDALHAELRAMHDSHVDNIDTADRFVTTRPTGSPQ